MANPFNYASGLLAELEMANRKASKDAIKSELSWAAEQMKAFDVSSLEEDAKKFVSEVAQRVAAVIDTPVAS